MDALNLLEDGVVLGHTHVGELVRAPVLVEHEVGMLLELLHVGADEHLPELDEIAVLLVINFNNTPRICAPAHFTAIGCLDEGIRAYYGKWNFAGDLLRLGQRFLVFVLVSRCLEDVNVVVSNVGQNLRK